MKLIGIGMVALGVVLLAVLWPRSGKESAVFRIPGMLVVIPIALEMLLVAGSLMAFNG